MFLILLLAWWFLNRYVDREAAHLFGFFAVIAFLMEFCYWTTTIYTRLGAP